MMKNKTFVVVFSALVISALLAACVSPVTNPQAPDEATPDLGQPATAAVVAQPDLTRTDTQGMVEVAVRPVNLANPGQTLDFKIGMNTHSVDLSMDLATLATLATDTGKTVDPQAWDAPKGGHHVSGILSFPAEVNGAALLNGAKRLTLTIRDVDVPERVFVWELGS